MEGVLGAAAGFRFLSFGCALLPLTFVADGAAPLITGLDPSSAFRFLDGTAVGLVARLAPGERTGGVGLPARLATALASGLVALLPLKLAFSFGALGSGGDVARFASTEWPPIPRIGEVGGGDPSVLTLTAVAAGPVGAGELEREPA